MFKFPKLKSILTEEYESQIDVTCPHCGQVTSFSYSNELPQQNQIVCRNCKNDIKNQFFESLLEQEINSLEELKIYILKLIISSIVLSILISIFLYFKRSSVIGYFILLIPLVVMLVTVYKYFQIRSKITELKQIRAKFGF